MDKALTGKYTALPCFIGIMALVFWLTFGVIGAALSDLLTLGIDAVTNAADHALTAYGINPVVHSLVIDGIFCRRGQRAELFARYRHFVLLPFHPGGYRLYGPRGVCDEPAAAPGGAFGPQFCADADRLWLLGACYHGHSYFVQ